MARKPALKVLGGDNPTNKSMEMCRTIGHAWDQFYPAFERPEFGWRFSLRCLRCTTERHDIIHPYTGLLIQRSYYWCEGYLMEKGVERPRREELRNVLFEHMRKELAAHNAVAEAVLAGTGA